MVFVSCALLIWHQVSHVLDSWISRSASTHLALAASAPLVTGCWKPSSGQGQARCTFLRQHQCSALMCRPEFMVAWGSMPKPFSAPSRFLGALLLTVALLCCLDVSNTSFPDRLHGLEVNVSCSSSLSHELPPASDVPIFLVMEVVTGPLRLPWPDHRLGKETASINSPFPCVIFSLLCLVCYFS